MGQNDPQANGRHHYIPADWVDGVEGDEIRLRHDARDACSKWMDA